MSKKLQEIVILKDDAVFWLDKNGRWRNKDGEFEHKRIIEYFHSSIKKDRDGYHLQQIIGDCQEKVYFNYEDTALFVFDVITDQDIFLILNTKKRIKLKPKKLSIKGDNLYMSVGEERIKFAEKGLIKISEFIEYDNDQYFIRIKNRRYKIQN
ncbi:MAG: MFS transporter permease [Deltaproteobacteria bacterium]|nr:MFS transporter permease [Deltaproteobacteria bacterium]